MIQESEWDRLAEILRQEIEGYGRLFGLLDEQRAEMLRQNPDGLLALNARMETVSDGLNELKRARLTLIDELWRRFDVADQAAPTLAGLLELCAEPSTPLFEELITEVNRLVEQTRRKLNRNQMLLRRSREIGQRFLNMIHPEASRGTYGSNGQSSQGRLGTGVGHYRAHA